jgi:hypothetical protein
MKRIISAVIATVLLAGGGIMTAASPASADTRPCMSRSEYRAVKNGMTLTRVYSIVGSKGRVTMQITSIGMTVRDHRVCGSSYGVASITYTRGRVSSKLFLG